MNLHTYLLLIFPTGLPTPGVKGDQQEPQCPFSRDREATGRQSIRSVPRVQADISFEKQSDWKFKNIGNSML